MHVVELCGLSVAVTSMSVDITEGFGKRKHESQANESMGFEVSAEETEAEAA